MEHCAKVDPLSFSLLRLMESKKDKNRVIPEKSALDLMTSPLIPNPDKPEKVPKMTKVN